MHQFSWVDSSMLAAPRCFAQLGVTANRSDSTTNGVYDRYAGDAMPHSAVTAASFAPPVSANTTSILSIKPNLKLMSNSERGKYYRRKRKVYTAQLSAQVAALRRQVHALTARQQPTADLAVGQRNSPVGSFAKLVREYCLQFEYGTPVHEIATTSNHNNSRVAQASAQQVAFLRAAMFECVDFGAFRGTALLLDQWQRYSLYHGGIWFELTALTVEAPPANDTTTNEDTAPPVIVVRAKLHVRITRETVANVFPHLIGTNDALVDTLIGVDVAYPCVNHFYFDAASSAIVRYDPFVDFVSALLEKMEDVCRVANVLTHARIAKDHLIGDVDVHTKRTNNKSNSNTTSNTNSNNSRRNREQQLDVGMTSDDGHSSSGGGNASDEDIGEWKHAVDEFAAVDDARTLSAGRSRSDRLALEYILS